MNQRANGHFFATARQPQLSAVALGFVVLLGSGCGTVLSGASYTGTRYPKVVSADQVRETSVLPKGHEVIGEVNASCSNSSGDVEWYDILLSDVLCSERKLVSSMRGKVADVGGTTLVGRSCDTDTSTDTRTKEKDGKKKEVTVETTRIACEGEVARPIPNQSEPTNTASPKRTSPASEGKETDVDEPDTDESTVAWRIRVRVTHAKDASRREPRAADRVEAVGEPPEGAERIGDIVARCEAGCSRAAVYNGVREAGARLGATAVALIRCVEEGEGWTCTGTAFAPKITRMSP